MAEITLTASMRSNLLSLKNTTDLMSTTQNRLSTGLKVNSAIDNPSSYYTAQSLNNRANDLSSLMDSMTQGIQTIKAANEGIEAITSLVEQAKSIANSARDTTDLEEREKYQTRLNDLRRKIDDLAKDANYKGINLIYNTGTQAEADTLKVRFNEYMGDNGTFIEVKGVNLVSGSTGADDEIEYGLGLDAAEKWGRDAEIAADKDGPSGYKTATLTKQGAGTKYADADADVLYELSADGTTYTKVDTASFVDGTTDIEGLYKLTVGPTDAGNISTLDTTGATQYYVEDGDNLKVVSESELNTTVNQGKLSSSNVAIDDMLIKIETATNKLREVASDLGSSYSVIETRQEFTENLINDNLQLMHCLCLLKQARPFSTCSNRERKNKKNTECKLGIFF